MSHLDDFTIAFDANARDEAYDDDEWELSSDDERARAREAALSLAETLASTATVMSAFAVVLFADVTFGVVCSALAVVMVVAKEAKARAASERARARARAASEETRALRQKVARDQTLIRVTRAQGREISENIARAIAPGLEDVQRRLMAMERAQAEAAKAAAATARDSGAVAGMLARDLAAARVDARDLFDNLRDELRTSAEATQGEVKKEMTMLWELVEAVEKETGELRAPMTTLAEEIRDVVQGVARESARGDEFSDGARERDEMLMLSEVQLEELRAVVADAASERIREAIDELLDSVNAVTSNASGAKTLGARLDDSQWSALTARLDAIGASVSEGVVEDDLDDLRVEIKREISKDIQGVLESVDDLKKALEANQREGSGGQDAAAAVKRWAEDKLKTGTPTREIDEQIKWQAAISETPPREDELVWVGEERGKENKASASAKTSTALNSNQGVSREEAFAKMQALLNAKPVNQSTTSAKSPEVVIPENRNAAGDDFDGGEEIWDPFATAADAENVARYMKENKERERRREEMPTPTPKSTANASDEFAALSETGLASLRSGREIARQGDNDVEALEEADEKFAVAIKSFESALTMNSTPGAEGNLGNAYLARGRVQAVLADLAMEEAREARRVGANAGLEGTAEMYLELAEENLIQAGRRFRVAATAMPSSANEAAGIKARAKALTGWGAALSLRCELVLSSQGDVADAESLVVAAAEKFKAAAAIEPESPPIYVAWGDAMRMCASVGAASDEDERLKQAEGCYREALRLDPNNVAALDGLNQLL